jgi:hypothetical protein
MDQVPQTPQVRRVPGPAIPIAEHSLPLRTFKQKDLTVESRLWLDAQPKLAFSWTVSEVCWQKGLTLLIFRNVTGFCEEPRPRDLGKHGELIAKYSHDGSMDEFLPEGTYYYTFAVHRKGWIFEYGADLVQIREVVPSAKVAIGRIEDLKKLQQARHELRLAPVKQVGEGLREKLNTKKAYRALKKFERDGGESEKPETHVDPALLEAGRRVNRRVQAILARRRKENEVKSYSELTPHEQEEILEEIAQEYSPGELDAWRELHGHG